MFAAFDEFNKKHYASGELLGAYGVADAAATKLVRLATASLPSPTARTWKPRSTWPAGT